MALYARMSFNNNGWQSPSGAVGKSTNAGNHENDFGFGFEEWFFNKRKFKDENGKDCHFAYLDPLRDFDPLIQGNEDELVLFTLQKINNGPAQRFIVARIPEGHWKFITHERYRNLRYINTETIEAMRNDLAETFNQGLMRQGLNLNAINTRFEHQKNCQNEQADLTNTSRLWNIELVKPIQPLMQAVTLDLPCPDWHMNTFRMFKLYDSVRGNFNHGNCGM